MVFFFELYYKLQKGIFFSNKCERSLYSIYYSDKIKDFRWNFAVVSDMASPLKVINALKQDFERINRVPVIYLSNDQLHNLSDFQKMNFRVNFTENWFRFDGEKIESKLIASEVKTPKEKEDFLTLFWSVNHCRKSDNYVDEISEEGLNSVTASLESDLYTHFIIYDEGKPASIASFALCNDNAMLLNLTTDVTLPNADECRRAVIAACQKKSSEMGCSTFSFKVVSDLLVEKCLTDLGFKKVNSSYRMVEAA